MHAKPHASLLAAGLLGGCMTTPTGPVIGSWQGEAPGPVITDLTLYGAAGASSGRYLIQVTVAGTQIGAGSGLTTWSGPWTKETATGGQHRIYIRLKDNLSAEIDRYALAPDGVLEPAPDYLKRPLTPEEIRAYSLDPISR